MARLGTPVLRALVHVAPRATLPMRMVANMRALANNAELVDLLITDPHSAGARVPARLIASMSAAKPSVEPELFTNRPFLLVHPAEDRWVSVHLSRLFFDRLACPKQLVILDGAGHLPCEQPGLDRMREALVAFLNRAGERPAAQAVQHRQTKCGPARAATRFAVYSLHGRCAATVNRDFGRRAL